LAGATIIKQLLIERDMNIKELAEKMEIAHQSMRNKLYRDKFSFEEVLHILDLLGASMEVVTKDTGKRFEV
jgi:DNA-binding Xre family transcriptional regulator